MGGGGGGGGCTHVRACVFKMLFRKAQLTFHNIQFEVLFFPLLFK